MRIVFAALIGVDVALIAWIAQSAATAPRVLLLTAFVTSLSVTAVVIGINRAASRLIAELEDL